MLSTALSIDSFSTVTPRLAHRETLASVVFTKGRALQDSEDVSYNGAEGSGTLGRHLELINYRLLVLSKQSKAIICPCYPTSGVFNRGTRYCTHILNTHCTQTHSNS